MTRDWRAAREKIEAEENCRVCGQHGVDPAHIVPRSRVPGPAAMDAGNIAPLCRRCHTAYDAGRLDLLPHLTREEQAFAAGLVGLAEAYERTTGTRSEAAA